MKKLFIGLLVLACSNALAVSSAIVQEKVPDWICKVQNNQFDHFYISTKQVMKSAVRSGDMWRLSTKSEYGSHTLRVNQTNGKGSVTDNDKDIVSEAICVRKEQ